MVSPLDPLNDLPGQFDEGSRVQSVEHVSPKTPQVDSVTDRQMDAPFVLLVSLWAEPGQEAALGYYEDAVLSLLEEHGGSVVVRVQRSDSGTGPLETQVLRVASDAALQRFMQDPRRLALTDIRDAAVARTETMRVEIL